MQRILTGLVLLLLSSVPLAAFELKNDTVRAEVDVAGNFKLWTTGGDPQSDFDDNQPLLDNDEFGTSFILVSVEGKVARFGSAAGRNVALTRLVGADLVTEWDFQGVRFTQSVSLYRGSYDDKDNLVRFQVKAKNNGPRAKKIGVKVVLATMLGTKDAVGFFAPGQGLLENGKFLTGADVPSVLHSMEKVKKSGANLELNLYGPRLVRPDKMYLARKKYLQKDNKLDTEMDSDFGDGFVGKSAVALVWLERTFQPGAADGIAFAAGSAAHAVEPGEPLDVGLFAPARVGAEPFWLGVVLHNGDEQWDVTEVKATLTAPADGLALDGSGAAQAVARIEDKKFGYVSWRLKPLAAGAHTVRIVIEYLFRSGKVKKTVARAITVTLP